MAGQYASQTSVSVERSRSEIEKTLNRYGATTFAYAKTEHASTIVFEISNRRVRFTIPMPSKDEHRFTHTPTGQPRKAKPREEAYEQAVRQSWRALQLVIKAKLEAVAANISTVEQEFLAYIVDPATNMTVGEIVAPQLESSYKELERGGSFPLLSLTQGD